MKSKKKIISLVLGSGGARGYAHIGAIEALLDYGYEIKSISGSSMGALIGALYACGKLEAYKKWASTLDSFDIVKLVDFSFKGKGLIQGSRIFHIIEELIGDIMIENLPITYTAVATDIIEQKEVWIQSGSLIDAVRASVAIPTIFTPKKMKDHYLVDGSVLNPIPIAPTISDDTDLTIVINLNSKVLKHLEIVDTKIKSNKKTQKENLFSKFEDKIERLLAKKENGPLEKMGIFGIMMRSIDAMQNVISEYKMAGYSPDIIINVPSNSCEFYEFHRAKEMIALGKSATREELVNKYKKG